ncbi:TolB family protein [Spirosoma utsteinense]|uniref:Uncharacterized protein n=2 Tax=Spirosoma utsteinense TaxID=2585773 RepID=A0ABR6WCI8_9BACT|nr:PD40 domain-containing protein [Spirosoma utsteinense]MBC3784181.1 hypothetical protein [Spirosoma utsteinense]MBC3794244.1 hypothetical protein [Spirosoma utsteinense]
MGQKAPVQEKNYALLPTLPPPPKPEPFVVSTIPLPPTVIYADLVNYLPDAKHLIMEVHMAGSKKTDLAVMNDDGSGFKCLTCGLTEEIGGEMPVPLPDGKRVYTPSGILECSPSIVDCQEARILPLVYPPIPGSSILMRIASNMSPDGIHVACTVITTKGGLVLVSELTRVSDPKGDRYELQHAKVVAGQTMAGPTTFRLNLGGAGEVKSFTDRGRSLTTSSLFEGNNFDLAKIDLTTGEVTRLTKHFSYDEGTYPSPDGKWVIFQTHRQTTRMDAFGLIPRPLIASLPQVAGVAYHRNAEFAGYAPPVRRFYGLSMVDQYGDRARLPEDGYTGQALTTASDNFTMYNHLGNFTWHPSSTYGIFWEQKDPMKEKPGEQRGRLRMIRFTARKPTKPLVPFSPAMTWATNLADIQWKDETLPETGTLKGAVSGFAQISTQKVAAEPGQEPRRMITYTNYSDDGSIILNGSESSTIGGSFGREVSWDADIKVTGTRTGFLKAQHVIFRITKMSSGTIQAELGNHKIEVDLSKGLPIGVPGELR